MQGMDHYKTLGVPRQASTEAIKAAYRKLARRYHPDVSKEPEAEARFIEITEAYEVLKNPQRRSAYDRLNSQQPNSQKPHERQPAANSAVSNSGFFKNLFNNLRTERRTSRVFGNASNNRQRRKTDAGHHATITISLEEAYNGTVRDISVPGSPQGSRRLRVRIPAGMQSGQQIRLSDRKQGDIYIRVFIAPHQLFRLEGRHVHMELPIAPWEAALGATVPVPTLQGPVDLQIPPGSQSGRQLRLKDRGLKGDPGGDQYVLLQIVTPPADHPDMRQLYEQLRRRSQFNPRQAPGRQTGT